MIKNWLIVLALLAAPSIFAQTKLTWSDLADVDFQPEYNEK